METRDIVVIGASTGGVEALSRLVRELPADLPAALFVVLHVSPSHRSFLPQILTAAGPLKASHPREGESFERGRIYVATPDRHLVLDGAKIHLTRGPRENGTRPAIDPLFRTAAWAFGPRVIGVILSGALDDGADGLHAVKEAGGLALVQDPETAVCGDMPRAAIDRCDVDFTGTLEVLAARLNELCRQPAGMGRKRLSPSFEAEADIALAGLDEDRAATPGEPSGLGCPECGGALNEIDGPSLRFRCRVGHAYGSESLRAAQQSALEGALWAALRALEEQAALARKLAARSRLFNRERTGVRFDERASFSESQARLVRSALTASGQSLAQDDP